MPDDVVQIIEQLEPGEHVCLLYEDPEEYLAALARFHSKGLTQGDRCIHIADDSPPDAIIQALHALEVDVAGEVERGAFRCLSPHEVYLQNGAFDPDRVRAYWKQAIVDALQAGFSGLHVTGDVSWVLEGAPGVHLLPEYEAGVEQTIAGSRMQAICCYSRRLLPPEVLASMFRSHSRVIFGDSVLHPDLLVRSSRNGKTREDWLEVFLGRLRQSETSLQEALDFKESMFSAVPAGIYTCDAEGRITSYNQAATEVWGTSPIIGDSAQRFCGSHRLYWPDGRPLPHSETPMARTIRDGTVCKDGEVIIERSDGSRATVIVNIVPLRDTQGRLNGAINCFVDITARKQAEAMLRQRTAEYHRLLENLPAVAYTCDAEGLITYFNPLAVRVWGREPKLNHPEDRYCGSFRLFSSDGTPIRHDQCWMALAMQTGEAQDGREIVIERPDGTRVTALAHAHPFHNEKGKLVGAVNVLVDITDRKQAEEAWARLAAIVESAEDAIISQDLEGVITSWNRGAQNLFGYSEPEAIGRPVTMLIPDDRQFEEPEILGRSRRGETIENYETVRRRKDGVLLDISLTVSPIVDVQGRIVGVSKIARDITERKRSEAALRDAERRKDEFLAMLSHELRNPMAPISSAVQLLDSPQNDALQQEAVDVIKRQLGTLTRLVNDLLDVSRVTTGRIHLQTATVDLNDLVHHTADSLRSMMDGRRQQLFLSLPGAPTWVFGDATRLEQVVVNLLSNAAKFTPEGGKVWVSLADEKDEAVLRVKDTGQGIDTELLPNVFDLFVQGATGLDRMQGGLGIGLALVKRLVEMHSGKITAHSDGDGKGSEFEMRIPLQVQSAEQGNWSVTGDGTEAATSTEEDTDQRKGIKVLLVDDSRDAVHLQSLILRHHGYQVETALDGATALQVAHKFRPHAVVLDIGLPGMDGYEVAECIRQQEKIGNVLLVAMTGYSDDQSLERAREAGFDHHLVKPVSIEDLQQVLRLIENGGSEHH